MLTERSDVQIGDVCRDPLRLIFVSIAATDRLSTGGAGPSLASYIERQIYKGCQTN